LGEYEKRRSKMLTYYPEVARVGNLASALSQAFAEAGSSLMAYSSVPSEKPKWSPFSEHPDARGMTVPEAARVGVGDRTCQVWIGFGLVPLGVYRLDFCWASPDDDIVDLDGWINAEDLLSSAQMIIGAYEHDQTLEEVAREFAATFGLRPTPKRGPRNHDASC
jgi:hypothetical protein